MGDVIGGNENLFDYFLLFLLSDALRGEEATTVMWVVSYDEPSGLTGLAGSSEVNVPLAGSGTPTACIALLGVCGLRTGFFAGETARLLAKEEGLGFAGETLVL